MKKLRMFEEFNYSNFFKGKKLLLNGLEEKENDFYKGYVAEIVIVEDKTDYNGETGLNNYEKFQMKLPTLSAGEAKQFKLNQIVKIIEVSKATCYKKQGDNFTDYLSIEGKIAPVQQ